MSNPSSLLKFPEILLFFISKTCQIILHVISYPSHPKTSSLPSKKKAAPPPILPPKKINNVLLHKSDSQISFPPLPLTGKNSP